MLWVRTNRFTDWLKRWWALILLVLVAMVYVLFRIFSPKRKSHKGQEIIAETKSKVEELKDKRVKAYQEIQQEFEERKAEIKEIKEISNKKERLQRLADFANRRNK